jgi:rsbT co-antagonist protein RsbR
MSLNASTKPGLSEILKKYETKLLTEWIQEQSTAQRHRGGPTNDSELRKQCSEFVGLLRQALEQHNGDDIESPGWTGVREMLQDVSRSRTIHGYSASETALFIFSLKKPVFNLLRHEFNGDGQALADLTWSANALLDKLGLYTAEVYQKAREDIINRQQQEMLELSTPVVKLWEGILALPMIGTLDSARTQIVMETLLQKIVDTGSALAIIDITGVPTVDTLTAQHLLKTVTAARLMGAECLISGIRPQIAQTIVHLGVDLGDVITKASLADAFALALEKSGRTVVRNKVAKVSSDT